MRKVLLLRRAGYNKSMNWTLPRASCIFNQVVNQKVNRAFFQVVGYCGNASYLNPLKL